MLVCVCILMCSTITLEKFVNCLHFCVSVSADVLRRVTGMFCLKISRRQVGVKGRREGLNEKKK